MTNTLPDDKRIIESIWDILANNPLTGDNYTPLEVLEMLRSVNYDKTRITLKHKGKTYMLTLKEVEI